MAAEFGIRGGATDKNLTLKTEQFSGFLRDMRTQLGSNSTMQRIVDFEVGKIMERAVEKTGKADLEKIKVRVKNRAVFNVGGRRLVTNYKGKAQRVSNRDWAEIEKIRAVSLATRIARIGLSKKSWYWIAQKLGQQISVPGYVANARDAAEGGPNNVLVGRIGDGDKYGVRIANRMPIVTFSKPNGRQALFAAIAGRISFYKKNLAKGVFDDIATISKKYRGLVVSPNQS